MVILVLDDLLARPLAAEREDAVLDVDVNVLLPHAGQLRLEHEALFLLENVHRRRPSSPDGLIAARLAGHVPEEPVDPVLHAGDTPEWIEAYECHFVHLSCPSRVFFKIADGACQAVGADRLLVPFHTPLGDHLGVTGCRGTCSWRRGLHGMCRRSRRRSTRTRATKRCTSAF